MAAIAVLAGCASTPPVQLYQLRAAPPLTSAMTTAAPASSAPAAPLTWQLLLPVRLPEYLDRDAIVVPQGRAGLQAQSEHRWAEPLRDSVPRLLRSDLARLLGEGQVWTSPVPPGVAISRQMRVELLTLEATSDRRSVTLQARWTVLDPSGARPPSIDVATLSAPAENADIDALVAAHRQVLWQLAERIAGSGALSGARSATALQK